MKKCLIKLTNTQSRTAKVLILASGSGLSTVVSMVAAVILSRLFNPADYGTYRQTFFVYRFVAPLLMLGLPSALYYFLPTESERSRQVVTENLTLLFMGGVIFSVFILLGGNTYLAHRFKNPELERTLLLMAPYAMFMLPSASFSACLLARGRADIVAGFNVVRSFLVVVGVIVMIYFFHKVLAVVAGRVIIEVLLGITAVLLMLGSWEKGSWFPSLSGMKRQVAYSLPLGFAQMIGAFSRDVDKAVISYLTTPETFAVYVNGAIEVPFVGILTGSITSVLAVDYSKLFKEGKIDEIVRLIHKAMLKSGLFLFPLTVFLFITAPDIMLILFGNKYIDSAVFFRIYVLLLPMRTLTYGAILRGAGKTWPILGQPLLTLPLNAVGSWYGVKAFGPAAAAVVTLVTTYGIALPYYLFWVRKTLGVPIAKFIPWSGLTNLAIISVAGGVFSMLVYRLWHPFNSLLCVLWMGILFSLAVLGIYIKMRYVLVPLKWIGSFSKRKRDDE